MKYCSLCSIAAKVKADILWQPGHHRALLQTDLSAICGEVSALFWARKFCEQELKLQSIKVLSGEEFDDFILQLSQLKRNSFGIIFFFFFCDIVTKLLWLQSIAINVPPLYYLLFPCIFEISSAKIKAFHRNPFLCDTNTFHTFMKYFTLSSLNAKILVKLETGK